MSSAMTRLGGRFQPRRRRPRPAFLHPKSGHPNVMKRTYSRTGPVLRWTVILYYLLATALSHAGGLVATWGNNTFRQKWVPSSVVDVKAIAAGEFHSLALKADGRVVAWGDNTYGPTNVPLGLSDVVAIAGGLRHSLAVRADGCVAAWGDNRYGQTNVPPGLSNVVAIAAGGYHNLALRSDGSVVGWGNTNAFQPFPSNGFLNVKAISAGGYHSLALKTDGSVVAWGYNNDGLTNLPPGLSNVVAIAAGQYHDLALRADGSVVAWGRNNYGQTNVPLGLVNVVAVAVGVNHSLALKADGSIVAWGYNWYGQANVPPGLSNVTAVAAGGFHSLALVSDGPVRILQEPESKPYGSNVTFSVAATGRAPLSYQWYFNGSQMSPNDVRISGTASPTLTITNLQFSDLGTYAVLVSNPFGSVISSGATVILPPFIMQQPLSRTVGAGGDVTFSVAASGTPPLRYQWLMNGTNLVGKTSASLVFTNVQPDASGVYSVLVSNAYGGVLSSNAVLTVTNTAPYILTQPVSQSAILGGVAMFSVNTRGSTPLSFQWRFNGVDIPDATNTALTLSSLRYDQAGYYTVAISNAFGVAISAKAQLSVAQTAIWAATPWDLLTNMPPGLTNLVAISANDSYVLGLKADGTVPRWRAMYSVRMCRRTSHPA